MFDPDDDADFTAARRLAQDLTQREEQLRLALRHDHDCSCTCERCHEISILACQLVGLPPFEAHEQRSKRASRIPQGEPALSAKIVA